VGTVLDLEGGLERLKGFEGCFGVGGVGSWGDGVGGRRRFEKKNPSGSGRRLDWLEASLSDLPGVVPECRWKCREPKKRTSQGSEGGQYPIVGF